MAGYYEEFVSLQDTIDRWQKNGEKLYDRSMPVMLSVAELRPYREYIWTRDHSRLSVAEWDNLVGSLAVDGWRKKSPAHFTIGRAGGAKLGEGNHRLAIAHVLGIKVPVNFHFYTDKVVKQTIY